MLEDKASNQKQVGKGLQLWIAGVSDKLKGVSDKLKGVSDKLKCPV